jgi:MFS family permease
MFNYVMVVFTRAVSGSDGFTGLVYLGSYLVPLLLAPVSGTLVDRVPRRALLLVAQSLWMAGAMTLCALEQHASPSHTAKWALLGVALSNGVAFSFLVPTRLALAGDVVGPLRVRTTALVVNILVILGFGVGPVIAGQLKDSFGWTVLFGIAACGLLLSDIALLGVRVRESAPLTLRARDIGVAAVPRRAAVDADSGGLRYAATYVRQNPVLGEILAATAVAYLPLGPIQLLVPQHAKQALLLSESARGWLMGALPLGLLVGGVLALVANRLSRRGLALTGGQAALGAVLLMVPALANAWWSAAWLFGEGVIGGVCAGVLSAELQARLPEHVRGRILNAFSLLTLLVPAVGAAAAGATSEAIGPARSLQAVGLVVCAAGLWMPFRLTHLARLGRTIEGVAVAGAAPEVQL